MKKNLILALCVPALLLAGCTAVEPDVDQTPESTQAPAKTNVVITARIGSPDTRVAYFEQQTTDENNNPIRLIHQQWQKDDVLYGWDDDGNQLNLVVDAVEEDVAYLSVAYGDFPEKGSIHMFYCGEGDPTGSPYACDLDINSEGASIDFSFPEWGYSSDLCYYANDPDNDVYSNVFGVMSADAQVSSEIQKFDGEDVYTLSADLVFTNQTALIGLQGIKGLDAVPGVCIERIQLSGVKAAAVISLVDDDEHEGRKKLDFAFPSEADQTVALECHLYADNETGEILFPEENPFLIAVFPREGGDETEDIVLSAHFFMEEDYQDEHCFSRSLGPREILAGNYYYIPTRRLDAPVIPSVKVTDASEEEHEFATLAEAFEYLNTEAVDMEAGYESNGGTLVTLLRDYTASGTLPALTGENENCTYVQFVLDGKTLTLDGCSLALNGVESFWVSEGTIVNTGDTPVLSVSTGFTALDEVVVNYGGSAGSPILVSGDGEVAVWSGRYSWITKSPLIGGSSTATSTISGGRFTQKPGTSACVQLEEGIKIAKDDDIDYPYVCIPQDVYYYLARSVTTTSGGDEVVLKTFSAGSFNPTKVYLALNNLFLLSDGRLVFEQPNWTGESAYSENHVNLFYSQGEGGIKEILRTQANMDFGSLYGILHTWDWEMLLWNRNASAIGNITNARFVKCEVRDGVEGHDPWRNLLLFPDKFTWPSDLSEKNPGEDAANVINVSSLTWDNALRFTVDEAQIMLNAGCVFLPAAGYITPTVTFDSSYNVEGRYWNDYDSSNPYYMSFNNETVSSYYWGSQNDMYSVRVAYTPDY